MSDASLALALGHLGAAARERIAAELSPLDYRRLLYAWRFWARDAQLAPEGVNWSVWLILAGRGFGKTRSAAEWVRERIERGAREVALIGATMQDVRDTMLGDGTDEPGEGFLNVFPPEQRPIWLEQKRRVHIPAFPHVRIRVHTAEEPEFRGPNTDTVWGDELCKWHFARGLWDNIEMTLRKPGKIPPRVCISTTPKPMDVLDEIEADAATVITTGSTFDNAANVDPAWIKKMVRKYAGTKLGLQELFAQRLGADDMLFSQQLIDDLRVHPPGPKFKRTAVAVDPALSTNRGSDDTGVVVAGELDGHVYVLDDRSGRHKPEAWGLAAIEAFVDWGAEAIIVERDGGGDLVRSNLTMLARVIETAPEHAALRARLGPRLRQVVNSIVEVHARVGKQTRAEPVSGAYQQGRIHHVGRFARLEKQQTTFDPKISSMANKDALDAFVHVVWYLLRLDKGDKPRIAGARALQPNGQRLEPMPTSKPPTRGGGGGWSGGRWL